jgi:filamentous hemagglutinin family protein
MNGNLYRLILDRVRNVLVPVSEICRAAGCRTSRRRAARRAAAAIPWMVLGGSAAIAADPAKLPVPAANFVTRGSATATVDAGGASMTIKQATDRAILNWNSFNIGAGNAVQFNQPNASSTALNRIYSADPSVIAGRLTANGQVYLYNQNGIVFANGAQLNLGGLVASSLNIDDAAFDAGILSIARGNPAFVWEGDVARFGTSFVRVEPGAVIRAANGGRIMMFAPKVENAGRIEAPDGQVILAAGAKVYLEASTDASLRGLLVEVDPLKSGETVLASGTVSNQRLSDAVGQILTARGNTTLAAFSVNQEGRISATTSVNANGSIYLLARDNTRTNLTSPSRIGTAVRSGTVTLGKDSSVDISPETSDPTTTVDAQTFNRSTVVIDGRQVWMKQDARIVARGGSVSITARNRDPSLDPGVNDPSSRIFLDSGATIDVAGTRDVAIPVERNIVTAELRGNELRDSPVQRDGILKGKKVLVDIRRGTSIADISGYTAGIRRGAGERTAEGGDVSLVSQGAVVLGNGAVVDVSGGSLQYLPGVVSTTKLVSNGKLYDVSDASPDLVYSAFFNSAPQREAGYVEGKSAGSIAIQGRAVVLAGDLRGAALSSPVQRDLNKGPDAGTLILGDPTGRGFSIRDYVLPDILVTSAAAAVPTSLLADPMNAPLGAAGSQVLLNAQTVRAGGFGQLALYSNERVRVDADLLLPEGGSVLARARRIEVNGSIVSAGGSIDLATDSTRGSVAAGFSVDSGLVLSTAGRWINDALDLSQGRELAPLAINGGTLSLVSRGGITVGAGTLLDVSGGARARASGKVDAGSAGTITVKTNDGIVFPAVPTGALSFAGQFRGYALAGGGTLSLTVPRLQVGASSDPGVFSFLPQQFQSGGFISYQLTGLLGVTIPDGTLVQPRADNFVLGASYLLQPTGTPMLGAVAGIGTLPAFDRAPTGIALRSSYVSGDRVNNRYVGGDVYVGQGARILTDIGATVTLGARQSITVLGTIDAPHGAITLSLGPAPSSTDTGFYAHQAIYLGSASGLSARGAAKTRLNSLNQVIGSVESGGSIALAADRGYVVVMDGAQLDVSGVSALLSIPANLGAAIVAVPQQIQGAAGSIAIASREGIVFDGTVRAAAGGPTAPGGAFRLTLDRDGNAPDGYPAGDREVFVQAAGSALRPEDAGLQPGAAVPDYYNGKAILSSARLAAARLDDITLAAESKIHFTSDVNLAARGSVTLSAQAISADGSSRVTVAAPYVAIGNTNGLYQVAQTADGRVNANKCTDCSGSGGAASFDASATLLDLIGEVALQNFGTVSLGASTDIRLRGLLPTWVSVDTPVGSLAGGGELKLSAQQVYATTLSRYVIDYAAVAGSKVIVEKRPGASAVPLSAASDLTIRADTIVQGGVVRAPVGSLLLDASTIELTPGSVTSVSADGQTIPFGRVENKVDWVYDLNFSSRLIGTPPEKRLQLKGSTVEIASGATVSSAGGGDLRAYEFVAGLGGSTDYLDQPGTYAVLKDYGPRFAPYDYQYSRGSDVHVGDQITFSGPAGGLPAGTYTLLPGHYATLDGAFSVRVVSGYKDLLPVQTITLADGSVIAPGVRSSALTGARDQRTSGFLVRGSAQTGSRSEYVDYSGNVFFRSRAERDGTRPPRLPVDAGQVVLSASQKLVLDGLLDLSAGAFVRESADGSKQVVTGRGGVFDLDAPKIAVLASGQAAAADFLSVQAEALTRIGAESILLGGTRTRTDGGVGLNVAASEVLLNNAGTPLRAGEIVLAAKDRITLADGSVMQASGAAPAYAAGDRFQVQGDGAIVRVSGDGAARTARQGYAGTTGALVIGKDVTLRGAAVELDATSNDPVSAIAIGTGTTLSADAIGLGASRLTFGAAAGVPGLLVDATLLGQLESARDVSLRAYERIDFIGSTTLGTVDPSGVALLRNLALDAPALRGTGAAADVVEVRAANVTWTSSGGAGSLQPGGTGQLRIIAQAGPASGSGQLVLGAGDKAVTGFDTVSLEADGSLRGQGTGSLSVAGDLRLQAAALSGDVGADQTIAAQGALTVAGTGKAATSTPGIGTRWALTGRSVQFSGILDAPAGSVAMRATSGDLAVLPGARINATGVQRTFDTVDAYLGAGTVSLRAEGGDLALMSGAVIDVSAAAGGGDGGLLSVSGTGKAMLAGTLRGAGAAGARGGRADLDLAQIDDMTPVWSAVADGRFTESVSVRLRTGELRVETGDSVTARRILLSADAGAATINGTLNAASATGGDVQVYARDDLTVGSGAAIVADAQRSGAPGGSVLLGSSAGTLRLQQGGRISTAGKSGGLDGVVTLRAARAPDAGGNDIDVNIAPVESQISGARAVYVEAVRTYSGIGSLSDTSSASSLGLDRVVADNAAFLERAGDILARLGKAGDPVFRVRPGVEVRSPGTLTVDSEWDLSNARGGGAQCATNACDQPGYLTLRAAQTLFVNHSLTDGFRLTGTDENGIPRAVLQTDDSWSYRLVGGSDLTAANPLQTLAAADNGADVIVASQTQVRTGTGFIQVAAQRDFRLADDTAMVYTAGRQAADVPGYTPGTGTAGFGKLGGALSIRAGRDVLGALTTQLVTNWQFRMGTVDPATGQFEAGVNTSWWVEHFRFRQNVGALGGGDVEIGAGRDVVDLSAMLPTSGRMSSSRPDASQLQVLGGGDLILRAGRDVRGGQFLVGKGRGLIEAGGSVLAGGVPAGVTGVPLYPILLAADSSFDVRARGDLNIETVVNSTVLGQTRPGYFDNSSFKSYFFTYSSDAAVQLASSTGNVQLRGQTTQIARVIGSARDDNDKVLASQNEDLAAYGYLPPSLRITAFEGSVNVDGAYSLYPAARSQVDLLAAQNVTVAGVATSARLYMSDADPRLLVGVERPEASLLATFDLLTDLPNLRLVHAQLPNPDGPGTVPLHAGDTVPVHVIAQQGDVRGRSRQAALSGVFPKPARVVAGRDVVDFDLYTQNLTTDSVTSVVAGRDVSYTVARLVGSNNLTSNNAGISVFGPGMLDVIAGRDIDLGTSRGVFTQGNLANPALPDVGASIRMLAGSSVSVDPKAFLSGFPDIGGAAGADFVEAVRAAAANGALTPQQARQAFLAFDSRQQLAVAERVADLSFYRRYLQPAGAPGLVANYRTQWVAFAQKRGVDPDAPTSESLNAFRYAVLWPELRASGRAAVAGGATPGDYSRGYDAIAVSQLGGPFVSDGNISLTFSQVKTTRGGAIDILAPGGGVNAGLSTRPPGLSDRQVAALGILTLKGGDINGLVRDNFQVNQSRVFTLEGGNILLWSSAGNIDAGRGPKTTIVASPPILTIDASGNLQVEYPGAASGSGIGVLQTNLNVIPGDVDLIAPVGVVNAGDAGIRSAGNLTIAAVKVVGADNIQVGGTSAGVPAPPASPGGLGGLTNTSEVKKSAERTTDQLSSGGNAGSERYVPSFITVEVIGLGEDEDEIRRRKPQ